MRVEQLSDSPFRTFELVIRNPIVTMDFLQSTLKDEIEKKRKSLQAAKSTDTTAASKKYISRAELERLREKEYLEEEERERKKKEVRIIYITCIDYNWDSQHIHFIGATSCQGKNQTCMPICTCDICTLLNHNFAKPHFPFRRKTWLTEKRRTALRQIAIQLMMR